MRLCCGIHELNTSLFEGRGQKNYMVMATTLGPGALCAEDGEAGFPDFGKVRSGDEASEGGQIVAAAMTPEHSGWFEAPSPDGLADGFHQAAADEAAFGLQFAVTGAFGVGGEAGDLASVPPEIVRTATGAGR